MTRFFVVRRHRAAAKSRVARALLQVVFAKCRPGFAETSPRGCKPKTLFLNFRHLRSGVIPTAAVVAGLMYFLAPPAFAQQDPGVRGGLKNTAGYLEYSGIGIPWY